MHNGQRGLASAIVLCSIALSFISNFIAPARAADDCLAEPKRTTPQGKHWYYRIERPSKRQCWYLGDEGHRVSQAPDDKRADAAPQQIPPAEQPAQQSPQAAPKITPKNLVADARAEFTDTASVPFVKNAPPPARQPDIGQPLPHNETIGGGANPRWQLAERWPEQQPANNPPKLTDTASQREAPPPPVVQSSVQTQDAPRPVSADERAAVTAAAITAPDDDSEILRIVLGALIIGLVGAALIGRWMFKLMRRRNKSAPRRPIWPEPQPFDSRAYRSSASHDTSPRRTYRFDPRLRIQAEDDVENMLRALRDSADDRATLPTAFAGRARKPTARSGARA